MKVLCMGETLLRYSTKKGQRFESMNFDLHIGGSETNIAVNLANLGIESKLFTKIPNNPLGKTVVKFLKANDVDPSPIIFDQGRMGVYYLEIGSGNRGSSVIYDRAYSSMTTLKATEINKETLFNDVGLFLVSGITAALNTELKNIVVDLVKYCKDQGITVAYDVNYRGKLWSVEECGKALKEIIPYVDILSAGSLDAENFLGYKSDEDSFEGKLEDYYKQMTVAYPNLKMIVSTKRQIISSSVNDLTGYMYRNGQFIKSNTYHIDDIVDRVGGGDAFMAGILYGYIQNDDNEHLLNFGCCASVLKHSIEGDANQVTKEEVETYLQNGTGRISR